MLTSLNNAAMGMRAQALYMDTIGNNVANINSIAFKKNRVTFEDAYYQRVAAPGIPVGENVVTGGGVAVSGTEKDFAQGALMLTGRELDIAIEGEGFFGVEMPDGSIAYTRDGRFNLDGEGYLVNSQGMRVFPFIQVPDGSGSFRISGSGEIRVELNDGQVQDLGYLTLFYISNPKGLSALGGGLYKETVASGFISQGLPGSQGLGEIKQGMLERSNVDLGEEMVGMIAAQRSFQVNARTIRTVDEMWSMANNMRR